MAKLLLAHPLFLSKSDDEQKAQSPYFPLGLLYLAGYVRQKGHEVAIFDGTFEVDESAFVERLAQEQPDVVGISALLKSRDTAVNLAQLTKDNGNFVLMGGPDPTKDPSWYVAHDQVDLVAHHEGEQTLVRLLDLFDAGQLDRDHFASEDGIAFQDAAGDFVINQPRKPIDNLDTLPMPARDLIDMDKYLDTWQELNGYTSMTITTARGCPYGCDWCKDAVHGDDYRQRSPESVAAEVKMLKETYGIDRLRVIDDVDGMDRDWLEAWEKEAIAQDAVVPFEPLNKIKETRLPMLDVGMDL